MAAAAETLHRQGLGMASVRFVCGAIDLHRALEQELARFVGAEDALLRGSCFDANTGQFETMVGEEDAVNRGF